MNASIAICLLSLTMTLGCQSTSSSAKLATSAPRDTSYTIVNYGKHTGIIIDAPTLEKAVPGLRDQFKTKSPTYYEVGWGDAGFYQAEKITSGLAVTAVFWPTKSVLHIACFDQQRERLFPDIEKHHIKVNQKGLDNLAAFIASSFKKMPPKAIGPGHYDDSHFFRAKGKYHLMNTCNKWTAKGIRASGVPKGSFFVIFASSACKVPAAFRQ